MIAASPRDRGLREDLSGCQLHLGGVRREVGRLKPALDNCDRGLVWLEQLWEEEPGDFHVAARMMDLLAVRAMTRFSVGDEDGSSRDTIRAEEIFAKIEPKCGPDQRGFLLRILAGVYYRGTDMRRCLQAVSIFRSYPDGVTKQEMDPFYKDALPFMWVTRPGFALRGADQNGGNFLNFAGHPAKAEALLSEAVSIVRAVFC
ncbi:MAG: hypothetical protein U0800_18585 [Isosphaeraceae bacterium]